jgi:leukotriene-A4 hydrolase
VIAHEIAHSWTGNLVTNKNFEHFWLNEGFTVFLERKIGGILKGELERQFASIEGWSTLQETVDTLGKESPMTKLVLDLKGVDPDDSFSSIPYEKGYVFLYYLETKVGGAAAMNAFLRQYVQKYKYESIDSFEFKKNFTEYFEAQGKGDAIKDVDWDNWFYSTGMPSFKPEYDTTLYDACSSLSKRWLVWDHTTPNPFAKSDLDEFSATQIQEFLQSVLSSETALPEEKVRIMEEVYGFNAARNAEIRFRWLRVCIKARWKDQLPLALQFVTDVGRMKFIRPIYRDLYNWEEARAEAIATFKKNRPYMMYVSAYTVAKDLHLEE